MTDYIVKFKTIGKSCHTLIMRVTIDNDNKSIEEVARFVQDETVKKPEKGSDNAAGYDLASFETCVVEPGDKRLIRTGIFVAIPEGVYGRVAPRSGLASRNFIDVGAGFIYEFLDRDYRGEIGVLLFNFGKQKFLVEKGANIAQIIFEKYADVTWQACDQLDETSRGSGGFGSTD